MCDALQLNWKLNPNVNGNKTSSASAERSGTVGTKTAKGAKSSSAQQQQQQQHGDKSYTLRACSIQKRMETETRKRQPKKRGPKPRKVETILTALE